MSEMLDVVNEQDEVIGVESRDIIHEKGLLHREVHVLFYTPRGTMIFQRRSMKKASWPGHLIWAASGHVGSGKTYLETAQIESKEETGLNIPLGDFHFIGQVRRLAQVDPQDGIINNSIRMVYTYEFLGKLEDLQIEPEEGDGFVEYSLKDMLNLPESEKKKFVPSTFNDQYQGFIRQILEMLHT